MDMDANDEDLTTAYMLGRHDGRKDAERSQALSTVTGSALSFNRCSDCDADCNEVKDPWACFSYDPERGYCPYLSGERKQNAQIGQSDEQPK